MPPFLSMIRFLPADSPLSQSPGRERRTRPAPHPAAPSLPSPLALPPRVPARGHADGMRLQSAKQFPLRGTLPVSSQSPARAPTVQGRQFQPEAASPSRAAYQILDSCSSLIVLSWPKDLVHPLEVNRGAVCFRPTWCIVVRFLES